MNTVPTAKELFDKVISENDEATSTEMMIEFAKMHVEAALEAASKKAHIQMDEHDLSCSVNKSSVLNAYPLDNIK